MRARWSDCVMEHGVERETEEEEAAARPEEQKEDLLVVWPRRGKSSQCVVSWYGDPGCGVYAAPAGNGPWQCVGLCRSHVGNHLKVIVISDRYNKNHRNINALGWR